MKKTILLMSIGLIAGQLMAQSNKKPAPPPPPPPPTAEMRKIAPPAPPAPPFCENSSKKVVCFVVRVFLAIFVVC